MDAALHKLDWSLVQSFLAVAEHGSLSAAAKALGASQPTVGRQIKAMEVALGVTLFVRQPRGLVLSETGSDLIEPAKAMQEAVNEISLRAAGREDATIGTVRITASITVSHYVLPPIIAAIRLAEPGIAIELVPSDESENLLFREADIALRMYRPTQLDVVTQHIGDMALGLFGSRDYLARTTKPESLEDMMALDLVGHDREERLIHGLRERGFDATRDWFKTRVDNPTVYWELVRAGCGVGFTLSKVGRADPDMIEIPTGIEIEPLPLWLTSHEAMRHTPRIRRVWTLLAEQLVQVIRDDAKT
ncbi:MAG: LysR family transcriptional regulator [Paracoccaceae bacterium]|nr:LysR family transcriptional regulator [Paracoccaceae bacterium]MDG2451705.1 LysR family transcriptional regulator [Paracoccaceae bacterium]